MEGQEIKQSPALALILKHWTGPTPEDGKPVDLPFNLEAVVTELDNTLEQMQMLYQERTDELIGQVASVLGLPFGQMFGMKTHLCVGPDQFVVAHAIFEGEKENAFPGQLPVVWFRDHHDYRKFRLAQQPIIKPPGIL